MDLSREEKQYIEKDCENTEILYKEYLKRGKVRNWFWKHKKEIIVGILSVAAISVMFILNQKKVGDKIEF